MGPRSTLNDLEPGLLLGAALVSTGMVLVNRPAPVPLTVRS